MTIDPQNDSATKGGFTRRSGLAVAWSAPVVAAAVSAPGAAASAAPSTDGPFVGVIVNEINPSIGMGDFQIQVNIGVTGPAGAPVLLPVDARVDVSTDQDVLNWGSAYVVDGPRAAHILIPSGSYPWRGGTTLADGSNFAVARPFPGFPDSTQLLARFVRFPAGAHRVTATVTSGPTYAGADGNIRSVIGEPTTTKTVTTF